MATTVPITVNGDTELSDTSLIRQVVKQNGVSDDTTHACVHVSPTGITEPISVDDDDDEPADQSEAPRTVCRAAVGRAAELGDLYDARTDSFCGFSMFAQKLPYDAVSSVPDPYAQAEVFVADGSSARSRSLNISTELELSILARLFDVSAAGSAMYCTETRSSRQSAQATLLYEIRTHAQRFSVYGNRVRDCLSTAALANAAATHFVYEVHWGARSLINVTDRSTDESDREHVGQKLKTELKQLATAVSSGDETLIRNIIKHDYSFEMFGDILPDALPTKLADAVALMTRLPTIVKNTNDGKGKPMRYALFPLSDPGFRKFAGLDATVGFRLIQLEDAAVLPFSNLFDDVDELRNEVADGVAYSRTDGGRDGRMHGELRQLLEDVEEVQKRMRRRLAKTLVKVRSALVEPTALERLLAKMKAEDELTKLRNRFDVILKPIVNKYKLTIHTGDQLWAGTDANVFVTLFGKYDNSDEQRLVLDSSQHGFTRSGSETTTVESKVLLELTKLRVRHDNTGLFPGWLLEKISVEDQLTGQVYEFVYNGWLSTDNTLSIVLQPYRS